MWRLALFMMLLAGSGDAAVLTAARTLPAGTVIAEDDLVLSESNHRGLTDPAEAVGLQARITIYEGRPLQATLLQAPQLVKRNQIVRLIHVRGALRIEADGRAMDAGAVGDVIRAMNLESRMTITATVNEDGTLSVR